MTGDAQFSETVEGVLERIIYSNEENAYCVAELRKLNSREQVIIAGILPGIQCGETLRLQGNWIRHAQYGEQLKVTAFESKLPATVHGIRKYLGSGLIRGIGKTYAKKIVDHFGDQTLEIISQQSGRLREVPGIGKQRAVAIKKAWDEQFAVRDVMMFLQTYGVTTRQCVRLVKKYGNNARTVLEKEPYRLATEIERIGFATADKIALNLGLPNNSNARIEAGLLHCLRERANDGHTASTNEHLIEVTVQLLKIDAAPVRERLKHLLGDQNLVAISIKNGETGEQMPACQLPNMAAAESKIARHLQQCMDAPTILPAIRIDSALEWAEKRAGFTFAELQSEAIRNSLQHKITILTGGPGTGKTTILRALVEILRAKRVRVLLASPTGRAAQRLSEAAGMEASTIHRLLKVNAANGGFVHNQDVPLAVDFLIVDEVSMLDNALASALLAALPKEAHLLLVGDTDQLPSVGAGNFLSDLISSQTIVVTRLKNIFRQTEQSGIIATAHAILDGNSMLPHISGSMGQIDPQADFHFILEKDAHACVRIIETLLQNFIPQHYHYSVIRQVQVLSPLHKGLAGVSALNEKLQQTLNPPKGLQQQPSNYRAARQIHFRETTGRPLPTHMDYGNLQFRLGDKVIQTRNNYDKGVFNGDTGIICGIAADSTSLSVDFGQETIEFAKSDLSDLHLAYAITIHKSQGSEYPVVIIPLLKQHFLLLQRNLLYTAITRASAKVFIIGDPDAYAMAVRNHRTERRVTYLHERLTMDKVNTRHPSSTPHQSNPING
jgi:exodeoxyribonuclease V alpha subunit